MSRTQRRVRAVLLAALLLPGLVLAGCSDTTNGQTTKQGTPVSTTTSPPSGNPT